jgi:hypothetical protein
MAVDYGRDISCTTDIDPLLSDVTGTDLMVQMCVRLLFCRKGSCLSAPTANTLDVRDFLNGSLDLTTKSATTQIGVLCENALLEDERIQTADVTASYSLQTKTLTLQIQCTGANGPFSLTIAVNQVTVQLIRQV